MKQIISTDIIQSKEIFFPVKWLNEVTLTKPNSILFPPQLNINFNPVSI